MTEGENRPPAPPYQYEPNALDARKLHSARTLVTVASILGPVSLFIGGVWASAAGLICGIVAWRKIAALTSKEPETDIGKTAKLFKRSCLIAMAVCGVALVLNTISFIIMYPTLVEMLESGDYGDLALGSGSTGSSGGSSVWG